MVGGISKGTNKNIFKIPTTWIFLTFVVFMIVILQFRYTETKLRKHNEYLMYQIKTESEKSDKKLPPHTALNVLNQSIGPSYPQSTR